MKPLNENQDDLFYHLGVALLELIEKPIDIELQRAQGPSALVLNGILLRAFDTPAQPSLAIAIGAHTIAIRPSSLLSLLINRNPKNPHVIESIQMLLNDGFTIHLKPQSH